MRVLAVAATAVAVLATPAHAALIPTGLVDAWASGVKQTVKVKRGDVLSELFADTPGGWTRAAFVNDLSDPNHLEVGQRLTVPKRDGRRWVPRPTQGASRSWSASSSSSASRSSSVQVSTSGTRGDGLNWTALFQCESGNNPRAVSPSGKYRGLAQFDMATWASVGFSGDPIDHSYAVQAEAARRLYAARGRSPWPHCGALL